MVALFAALLSTTCMGHFSEELTLLQVSTQVSFDDYIEMHGRSYRRGSDEYSERKAVFERRLQQIRRHNSQPDRSWTAGVNHLTDWTAEEYAGLLGWRGHARAAGAVRPRVRASLLQQGNGREVVSDHSWNSSIVGHAVDQGACGSCWAVATAKLAEINHQLHTGEHRSFSAQELVDCVPNPQECGGSGGCNGATVELAMAQMMYRGLATEEETPYKGKDLQCNNPKGPMSVLQGAVVEGSSRMPLDQLTSPGIKQANSPAAEAVSLMHWERLPENQEEPLQAALLKGAVAVSVDGTDWSAYWNGIFDSCRKDAVINHAVVATGFGVHETTGQKYWKILNSWGPTWGEEGYIRLLRTDQYCGTDHQPEQGTGCKGGPASVDVCGMCGVLYDNVFAQFGSRA